MMSPERQNGLLFLVFVGVLAVYISLLPFSFLLIDQFASEEIIFDFFGSRQIEQTFRVLHPVTSIRVKCATFMRQNHGLLQVTFWKSMSGKEVSVDGYPASVGYCDDNWTKLGSSTIPMQQIQDNRFYELPLPAGINLQNGNYSFSFSNPDGAVDNFVSPWFCLFDAVENGNLIIDHQAVYGDMAFKVLAQSTVLRLLRSFGDYCNRGYIQDMHYSVVFLFVGVLLLGFVSFWHIVKETGQ